MIMKINELEKEKALINNELCLQTNHIEELKSKEKNLEQSLQTKENEMAKRNR